MFYLGQYFEDEIRFFKKYLLHIRGYAVNYLWHYVTSRKVPGLISNEVTGILVDLIHVRHIMAFCSTQPLTELSISNLHVTKE